MRIIRFAVSTAALFIVIAGLPAQEAPEFPKPTKEHRWLHQFVGEWESDAEASMGPGQPPMKCQGTIDAKMLGGFWLVSESKTVMMGTPIQAVQTIGYDPAKGKYIGAWVDSVTSYMWTYEGTVDRTGKTLTLEAEGPNLMLEGKLAKFRDEYEFKSKDHIVARSSMQGDDGKWMTFMTSDIRRKK